MDNVCVRGVHVCGECGGGQCVCVGGGVGNYNDGQSRTCGTLFQ